MAISQRIFKQTDGLDTLKELAELIKNPSAIAEAHEEARKQLQLTEQDQKKYQDAKAFMAQYDGMSSELKKQSDDLAAKQDAHNKAVFEFNEYVSQVRSSAQNKEAELKQLQASLEGDKERFYKLELELKQRAKLLEDEHAAWQRELDKKISDVAAQEKINEQKFIELLDLENKLKAKAQRLLAEAQS